jgi:hypothetical protein
MKSNRMGPEVTMEIEITQNDGAATLSARSRSGPVNFDTGYTLIEMPTGTQVRFWNHINAQAPYRMAEDALQAVSDEHYKADLGRLKELLESADVTSLR